MPFRTTHLVTGEFYHIVKRGVEERDIFLDDADRLRFCNGLIVFNDSYPAPWNTRAFWEQRDPTSLHDYIPRDPLVEIHAFALMGNHFHLLLRQLKENGISDFMKKQGGYSYYFNKRYQRVGPLFQGRFKAILIKTEEQIKNVFVYIHVNPLDIIELNWKEEGIKNPSAACQFLEKYLWSSYFYYLSKERSTTIIHRDFFFQLFGGENGCRKEVEGWVQYKADVHKIKDIIIE